MSDKNLPVYDIQDFKLPVKSEPVFYVNLFQDHLRANPFVQKPHKHNFYILILITHGSGTHTIDFVTYPVKPQTVFFLSPGQVHSWQLSNDIAGYILFFNLDFYLLGFPANKLQQYPFLNTQLQAPVLNLSVEQTEPIIQIFQELWHETQQKGWKHQDLIRNYIDVLLIRLARFYFLQNSNSLSAAGNFTDLQKLEALVELHYKQHKPASFYAQLMNLSLKQLNQQVKQALGKSVTDLIQNRLILEASRLLLHTDMNITRIAAELGYFDNSYFTRFFKKRSGQTPEQFRQAQLA